MKQGAYAALFQGNLIPGINEIIDLPTLSVSYTTMKYVGSEMLHMKYAAILVCAEVILQQNYHGLTFKKNQ